MITRVKPWVSRDGSKEVRIYIDVDGREGVYYQTGSGNVAKGTLEDLAEEDLAEAKRLAIWDDGNGRKWHTMYEEDCKDRYEIEAMRAEHQAEEQVEQRAYRPRRNHRNSYHDTSEWSSREGYDGAQ